jgi:hypothetical protein
VNWENGPAKKSKRFLAGFCREKFLLEVFGGWEFLGFLAGFCCNIA